MQHCCSNNVQNKQRMLTKDLVHGGTHVASVHYPFFHGIAVSTPGAAPVLVEPLWKNMVDNCGTYTHTHTYTQNLPEIGRAKKDYWCGVVHLALWNPAVA
mmetsp:Transcript_83970/g.166722  ORF Transcript_83970/g.166722 Transcript_83970/m.166722 type:complete len:100 (+) Transcript_83970:3280-3579(+)